ncbi:MAG: rhomboid family intramembrane serine protease [Bombilactobacillus mellis]|uniref:rhomboid family intramembrane serine protease n=1 Tax=Bombilactobacillus mellis TaxID=1218508 RepID=UPI00224607C7|nr:rhomboid family intramembrane serine protease [Bombilactobacillus mellis]MCT6841142.1 rhomboid family intramembrane serine protease [Bombilactobacillus mellis]MCT6857233.1 rhomboid family intramembrane serine protease [Bombilactobacillus mellis]MCT6872450.1 rhomboid family intramembrane serine protease [Bombilactobacillus mellis]MCX0279321.1 rhomboid family intramembrane serine protease [Bombilactobacillus mellis]
MRRIRQLPWATYTILLIQVIVFGWEILQGGSENISALVAAGAKVNGLVAQGQWWRLITPIFVHIGWQHILINSLTLYFMGQQLEFLYGPLKFIGLYLLSGIGGNLMSFAFGSSASLSAGASTSLFGLFGLYVTLGLIFRKNEVIRQWAQQFLLLIILNLGTDIFMGGIDIWGHIGGALTGCLLGFVISVPQMQNSLSRLGRIISIVILLVLAVVLYQIGVARA